MASNILPILPLQYECKTCDFISSNKKDYSRHTLTAKHTKLLKCYENASSILPNLPIHYECKYCDFISCNKKDYNRHILTAKHTKLLKCYENAIKCGENLNITPTHIHPHIVVYNCNCGKEYNHDSSYYRHKKKCVVTSSATTYGVQSIQSNELDKDNNPLLMELVKQNQEFKELMMEQNKQNCELQKQILELAKTAGHNNNNTINNKFNLHLFLNETCKDAMNITEFVNSLVLNFEDLENMGHLGYVEGICKIFLREIRGMDITKRPFHCSDVKRETMFVRDLVGWEKENSDNEKLTATIKRIASKNLRQASAWIAAHPKAVLETDSHPHMQYMKMMSQCLGGLTAAEDKSNYNKIIKRVAQEVLIDKGKE